MSGFIPPYDDPLAGPFWRAARDGELRISWCDSCDHAVWFPRPQCPDCSSAIAWKRLSGRGRLLSWTVVHKTINPLFAPGYIPALVEPEEAPGVRLVTQIIRCHPDELRCDMNVEVVFEDLQTRDGECFPAPLFCPLGASNP